MEQIPINGKFGTPFSAVSQAIRYAKKNARGYPHDYGIFFRQDRRQRTNLQQ